ncbi:hypothetical protein GCM10023166_10680 [Paeniglutamicibacter cryotolerans]|uniref:TadE-like domain-containing protein n=2 Tax=Paeniglutamicibacter cryotolerans TaxID=670079 RepID=A0A839QIT2_9MICC|nr:TadE family protein [Paeniglutamicibacter cryotolerans]MBB2996318.1 hypothetical protein [Paeniglutamicibacter cryotolerans]
MGQQAPPGRRGGTRRGDIEQGSAIAEFVMVSGLLLAVFASVLQLTLVLHVRNTLLDAAATGARYGTLADRGPGDGAQLTRELVSSALSPRFASDVRAVSREIGGRQGLEISINTGLPLVGFFALGAELRVTGEAVRYGGG